MNMDMLSRGFDILQRAGGMEQISQLMVIVYGVLCVFGLLNCILGYRILRFWMMIFGFIIGAGAGFGVTYMSGVQDKMVIAGAMAGLGIVLAVVSFLIYRAGIFVLGFGIGITLSIYLVHPTSSFSFFLCILIGVGLGVLAMRYAKGVIIVGTSILGGVLAGLSIAKIAGLAQFPYGVGMAAGIAILGMLIQFAINKDRYDEEDDEEEDDETRQQTNNDDESKEQEKKRGAFTRVLAVLIAILSVVFFLVTEDLSLRWTWTDQWTIWMVVIGLVQIVVFFVGRKWKNVDDEDEQAQQA